MSSITASPSPQAPAAPAGARAADSGSADSRSAVASSPASPSPASPAAPPAMPPMRQVSRLVVSLWAPQAVHAAAELGLADALVDGPRTSAELAAALGTHADATDRLLHALVVLGLLDAQDDGFALTDLGQCLVSDSPVSVRAWARLMGGPAVWNAWGRLTDCVRTGLPVFALPPAQAADRSVSVSSASGSAESGVPASSTEATGGASAGGDGPFEAMAKDAGAAAIFHRAMFDLTRATASSIIAAVSWDDARTIVDIGGGTGALLAAVLDARPEAQGSVFDLASARDEAERVFAARGLAARAAFVTGDIFADAPPTADVYLLKSVIHDWDDARSVAILRACREAMSAEARLLMVEVVGGPHAANPALAWMMAFSDLNMLVNVGGRERDEAQYRALLEAAGLRVVSVRQTKGPYAVFEAVRA